MKSQNQEKKTINMSKLVEDAKKFFSVTNNSENKKRT